MLVAKGFLDEATGLAYTPATYPDHGGGLFFVGVEQDGRVIAYALNHANQTFVRVAAITTKFPRVAALEYDPEIQKLWVVCDDGCLGDSATFDVAQSGPNDGKFVVSNAYARPADMPNLNNEGFAITPQAECVGGLKPVIWTDDGDTGGHALRTGTLNCTVPTTPPPGNGGGGGQTPAPGGGGNTPPPTGGTPPTGGNPPLTPDRTAPTVGLALKLATRGTYAVRKTGKFGVTITLGEKADITVSATARKNSKSRARTILKKTTRKGVAAGKRTITSTLSSKIRKALKKGETVTVTVAATDAAGNKVTKRATGKVR